MRARKLTWALALLGISALAGLTLTACGGSSNDTGTSAPATAGANGSSPAKPGSSGAAHTTTTPGSGSSTATGGATTSTPSTTTTPSAPAAPSAPVHIKRAATPAPVTAALKHFTACMREHGINNYPEPEGAGFNMSHVHIDLTSPQFKAAEKACNSILQAIG